MHVAICIVGYRNPEDIAACLAALRTCSYPDFEVMICENGGPEAFARSSDVAANRLPPERPVRVLLAPGNGGYAAGVNLCMRATASADAWWILNPDTEPHPQALDRMMAALQQGLDVVGSTVCTPDGRVESRGGRWNTWLARATSIDHGRPIAQAPGAEARRVDYVSGASMLVGRRFLEAVGPMREDYFLYGEEVEWCLRREARGMRFGVAADAQVMHRQGTTTGSVATISKRGRLPVYLDERNKLLITRDCFPARLPCTAVGALLMGFLRFARRGAWRQQGYAIQGWWRGLANERGKPAWLA